jgi:hypothetical protein
MKKIYYIYIAIAVIILAIIALYWKQIFGAKPKPAPKNNLLSNKIPKNAGAGGATIGSKSPIPLVGKTGVTSGGLDDTKILSLGSTGPEVKELQQLMNSIDSNNHIDVDGVFGPDTLSELKAVAGVESVKLSDAWSWFVATSYNPFDIIRQYY